MANQSSHVVRFTWSFSFSFRNSVAACAVKQMADAHSRSWPCACSSRNSDSYIHKFCYLDSSLPILAAVQINQAIAGKEIFR